MRGDIEEETIQEICRADRCITAAYLCQLVDIVGLLLCPCGNDQVLSEQETIPWVGSWAELAAAGYRPSLVFHSHLIQHTYMDRSRDHDCWKFNNVVVYHAFWVQ